MQTIFSRKSYPNANAFCSKKPIESNYYSPNFCGYNFSLQTPEEILASVAKRLIESTSQPLSKKIMTNETFVPINQQFEHLGKFCLQIDSGSKKFVLVKINGNNYQIQKMHRVDANNNALQINVLNLTENKATFHSLQRQNSGQSWSEPFSKIETENKNIISDFYNLILQMIKMKTF